MQLDDDRKAYLLMIHEVFGFKPENINNVTTLIENPETVEGALMLLYECTNVGLIQSSSSKNLGNGVEFSVTLTDAAVSYLALNRPTPTRPSPKA